MRLGCVVGCAAVAPLLIATSEPVRLQPSSKWVVDYADNSCRLIRTFGEGETKTILFFESEAPGRMDMTATGKPLKGDNDEVSARFLPVGGKMSGGRRAKTTQGGEPAILWSAAFWLPDEVFEKLERENAAGIANPNLRPPPINLADRAAEKQLRQQFAEKATELEVQTRRNRPVILETGPIGGAIKAFEKCGRDSLRDWGVDPDLEDKIARPAWPAGGVVKWFSSNDYPRDMVFEGKESDVKARLLIDAAGKVTKCTSLSHYDEPDFNQATCNALMQRAKFEPAELADGTKVPTYYLLRIRWVMAR
jgi:hypothetical protein